MRAFSPLAGFHGRGRKQPLRVCFRKKAPESAVLTSKIPSLFAAVAKILQCATTGGRPAAHYSGDSIFNWAGRPVESDDIEFHREIFC